VVHVFVRLLLCGSLILFAVSLWQKDVLPDASTLQTELLDEPQQHPVTRAAFQTTVNNVTYSIQPLYRYDLYGLVVSLHDAQGVVDTVHAKWKDSLNVADLCVVWGDNVRSGAYRDIRFSSAQYQCFWQTDSSQAAGRFATNAISNNHLLTDNVSIAKNIHQARIGDQIHFRGYLAEYSHNDGFAFKRGTSTTRTDDGDGACETVYVEEFEILRRGGGPWRTLLWTAVGLFVVGLIAWVRVPVRFKH